MYLDKKQPHFFKDLLEIDEDSKVPKYQQLVDTLITDIEIGVVTIGDKIPSINETSEEFYLSRDTVVKAYELLRNRGIITAVRGKGFYIASTANNTGKRILLLFSKLSDHKRTVFSSFVSALPADTVVDLQIHNCDPAALEKMIIENLGKYDHYVIMPHLKDVTPSVKAAINKIPKEQLLLLGQDLAGLGGDYACLYEDFELDIYEGLSAGLRELKKYEKLYLIFPTASYYCPEIKSGFVKFCDFHGFDWEIADSTALEVAPGEAFILIEDQDLVQIIKQATAKNLPLGAAVGIISYNNSPLKELLAGGISVLSTDFEKMGTSMAHMILQRSKKKIKNAFSLVKRNSL